MSANDTFHLNNSQADLRIDRDAEGNLRFTIIDLLNKAAANAATPKQAAAAADAKDKVEKAQTDPTAKDEAVKAVKKAADDGCISREEFEAYKQELNGRFNAIERVLPRDQDGNLLVIQTWAQTLVANFRGREPNQIRWSAARFISFGLFTWVIVGVVAALLLTFTGWGAFNEGVLGGLVGFGAGVLVAFATGYVNTDNRY